jgi:hypothetical protein
VNWLRHSRFCEAGKRKRVCTGNRAANYQARRQTSRFAQKRGELPCLSERGRRVFENAGSEKWRRHPLRIQRRNFREVNGRSRRAHQRRGRGVMIITRSDERDRTFMLAALGIGMNTLMQLRRRRKRHGQEKSAEQSACNHVTAKPRTFDDGLTAHVSGLCFVRVNSQVKFCRPNERHPFRTA